MDEYLLQQIALLRLLIYQERNAVNVTESRAFRPEIEKQWLFVNQLHIQAEGCEFTFTEKTYPPIVVWA